MAILVILRCEGFIFTVSGRNSRTRSTVKRLKALVNLEGPADASSLPDGTGAELNARIIDLFEGKRNIGEFEQSTIHHLLEKDGSAFTYAHVLTLMQRAARARLDVSSLLPLDQAVKGLNRVPRPGGKFTTGELSNAFYSLRMMRSDTPHMDDFLTLLATKLEDSDENMSSQEVANALNGMQRLSHRSKVVRRVLGTLAKKVLSSEGCMNAQEIGMSLFGLRNMGECAEVNAVLYALADVIDRSTEPLGSQAIGNGLNGLQHFNVEESKAASAVLTALLPRILACREPLTLKAVGGAVYGLRSSTAAGPTVRHILHFLTDSILAQPDMALDNFSLSSALHGLRNMSDEHREVCAFLAAMTALLQRAPGMWDAKTVANSLLGVSRMRRGSRASRHLVRAITAKITPGVDDAVDYYHNVGLCLYGLQSISMCKEVRVLLSKLEEKVTAQPRALVERDVSFAFFGLKNKSSNTPEVRAMMTALAMNLALSTATMSARSASMCVQGLSRQCSRAPSTVAVLDALRPRLERTHFDAQACGNILYGLHSMNTGQESVRTFLTMYGDRLEECEHRLSAQEVSNAFYGLQGMDSRHDEVARVLGLLCDRLDRCKGSFTSKGVCAALYGLQSMGDEQIALYAAGRLAHLLDEDTEGSYTPMDVASGFFGLQGMTSESEDVRRVIAGLTVRMNALPLDVPFNARDIGYCLSGLHNKDPGVPEVGAAVAALSLKIANSAYGAEPNVLFVQKGKRIFVKKGENAVGGYGFGTEKLSDVDIQVHHGTSKE